MKKSLKPFKIKVRFLSRAAIIAAMQEGECVEDQIVQIWGTELWTAANKWGRENKQSVYGIFLTDGTILFYNGGDHPVN